MADLPLLNYETLGNKQDPAVFVIHGLFGDKDNLKAIAKPLDGYFRILVDARNHGDSFHSDDFSYVAMAADIARLADHLGLDTFAVLGHSMGGKIAMETALQYPQRVTAVIAADIAPVAYPAHHQTILETMQELDLAQLTSRRQADQQMAQNIKEQGVRQFLLKNLRQTDNGYQWRLNLSGLIDHYEAVAGAVSEGNYSGPVLFIKGGQSNYLTADHQAAVEQRFSNTQVKIIEGTGHWLHAEKHRIFERLCREFFDREIRHES
ncbi:alpha/beta hydrolase [Idiomarina tyrosinivorans]|uniref:Alpha/beta hydrolase n=1 Tax=Idiomarina tyrosinivorans TaxID=1445662 RepID=A0A432ZUM1_9GAMM|nr:alpha/beta fold hydrolase [Idiomarina tyrosinivorans]RUO81476.1 alpha/beta hydrolase [Idiomarina tyrosinivorans]